MRRSCRGCPPDKMRRSSAPLEVEHDALRGSVVAHDSRRFHPDAGSLVSGREGSQKPLPEMAMPVQREPAKLDELLGRRELRYLDAPALKHPLPCAVKLAEDGPQVDFVFWPLRATDDDRRLSDALSDALCLVAQLFGGQVHRVARSIVRVRQLYVDPARREIRRQLLQDLGVDVPRVRLVVSLAA